MTAAEEENKQQQVGPSDPKAAPKSQVHAHHRRSNYLLLLSLSVGVAILLLPTATGAIDPINYLQRYGYLNESTQNGQLLHEDSLQEAVVSFQRFASIPETGHLDDLTLKLMQMPRCGNKDHAGKGENGKRKRRKRRKRKKRKRRKRYALQGSKWRRQQLTYRISQYPSRLLNKKHDVDAQIEKAFKVWSQVAPIDFVPKREGRVHIDIKFASGEHGDGDAFDGPGNTLAHAYFPQYGGDAHFDDQEYWTIDSYAGTNIFQVAAHELGHSLGLGHSSVREALMAPFYQKYKPNFKLHPDDVLGIQALYGEKSAGADDDQDQDQDQDSSNRPTSTSTEATPRRAPPTSSSEGSAGRAPDMCSDSASIDAITRTEDGSTYVFRGQYYWLLKNEGVAAGYPARISRDWDGLPSNLDAALTWSDGKTFFFKGDKYWRYTNKRREPGYPKLISAGFAGIPNNIDTAFVWSGNGKTYFFKRDKYWRFDSKQDPPVSSQYPKSLKNWAGLPASGLDAAFKWENGMTYFFKGDQYYRFDDRQFEVDQTARPAFPRSTGEWWFGCPSSNLPLVSSGGSTDSAGRSQLSSSSFLDTNNDASGSHRSLDSPDASDNTQPNSQSSSSIFSGLSSLFSRATAAPTSSATEWAFHQGIGEEIRKLMKAAKSLESQTAWSFPSGFSHPDSSSGNRERSLSELRAQEESK